MEDGSVTVAGVRWVDGPAVAVEVVRSDVLEGDERGLEDDDERIVSIRYKSMFLCLVR